MRNRVKEKKSTKGRRGGGEGEEEEEEEEEGEVETEEKMKTPENAVVLQPPATSQRGPEIKKHETIAVYTPCSSIRTQQ